MPQTRVDIIRVPGAFEIPVTIANVLDRSEYPPACVIALGVILMFAINSIANYSAPVFAPDPDRPQEWEILIRLTGLCAGTPAQDVDVAAQEGHHAVLELAVIEKTGFISYFLIVADFVAKGREMGVSCVARGSAAPRAHRPRRRSP